MIRSFTINELEELTSINKRTISDYITKGLLIGSSHRGRGAVYSQRDLNALRVIPRLRTLMKKEYGALKAVASFLEQLSISDLQALATRKTERAFIVWVHRLRVRLSLIRIIPHVPPEKLDEVLSQLTPEQICSVDQGRVHIGAVINMRELFAYEQAIAEADDTTSAESQDGYSNDHSSYDQEKTDRLPQLSAELLVERDLEATLPDSSGVAAVDMKDDTDITQKLLTIKLDEIANRLDRVEQMLENNAN
jgi:DNA-binding transcriptional MerR regulator